MISISLALSACSIVALPPLRAAEAVLETVGMHGSGDVADDACIWVHPRDPSKSVIIGTNKSNDSAGGLYAFRLDGRRVDGGSEWRAGRNRFDAGAKINNVDVRYGFPAGDARWDLVCASNRSRRTIDIFRVATATNADFAGLALVGRIPIGSGFAGGSDAPYGLAMFHARSVGRFSVLVSDKRGHLAQYTLSHAPERGSGETVRGTRHDAAGRPWLVNDGSCPVEGIVADDDREAIYVASEDHGVYRYETVAGVLDPSRRVVVAAADMDARGGGPLTDDIEGLAIYRGAGGRGYLIASSQGQDRRSHRSASSFAVFERHYEASRANRFLGSFSITAGRVDGVRFTDGIDACSLDLGGPFRGGLFIAHDGEGDSPTNYKLVPWKTIAAELDLIVEPSYDPRRPPTAATPASPVFDCATLDPTRDKPQSKVWYAHGRWWAWLANGASGGRIWERTAAGKWRSVKRLDAFAAGLPGRADVIATDDLVVAALVEGPRLAVAALYWNDGASSWLPATSPLAWQESSDVETVTIARHETGSLWVAYPTTAGGRRSIVVRQLDAHLASSLAPHTVLARDLFDDEICAITALEDSVAVVWSDQDRERLCLRRLASPTATAPNPTWSAVEIVAQGGKTADDHLNFCRPPTPSSIALVAATKLSVDARGQPNLALRVLTNRRWHTVPFAILDAPNSMAPTRPIALWIGRPLAIWSEPTGIWLQEFSPAGLEALGQPRRILTAKVRINNVTGPRHAPAGVPCLILCSDATGKVWEAFVE